MKLKKFTKKSKIKTLNSFEKKKIKGGILIIETDAI